MGGNQDARPFIDLQKDAEEFRQKFDGDIKKCMLFLDEKITTLICDPDSLGSPSRKSAIKQNALVEFSKAKYDIFIGVKTLMNEMEREWMKYISEMKKLFIENVEIFLAGTKLEVKLPTSEFQTSPGFKKSPRKEKSSLTDSLYPIINSFAKNMAALGSPLKNRGGSAGHKSSKGILDDSCLRNDKDISDDESDSEDESVNQVLSDQLKPDSARVVLSKNNAAILRATPPARNEVELSDSTASDSESDRNSSEFDSKPRGRSRKEVRAGLNTSRHTPRPRGRRSNEESLNNSVSQTSPGIAKKKESENERDVSPPGSMSRGRRSRKETTSSSSQERDSASQGSRGRRSSRKEVNYSLSPERDVSPPDSMLRGGRSRKETKSSSSQEHDAPSQRSRSIGGRFRKGTNSSSSQERDVSPQVSKSRGGRLRKENNSSSSQERDSSPQGSRSRGSRYRKETNSSSSQERDVSSEVSESKDDRSRKETEHPSQAISARKPKGRGTQKPVENKRQTSKDATAEGSESEESVEIIELESSTRSSRQRNKTPAKPTRSAAQKPSTTAKESESESNTRSSRQKGRTPAKPAVQKSSMATEESESESTKEAPSSVTKGRKGKTPAKHKQNSTIDNEPRSRRRGAAIETPVAPPSPKKSNLSNSHVEFERSKSPKKVTFTPSFGASNFDSFTPYVKSKPSIRRKTLLPNLDEIASGADIIPGASRGRANKRKTIGGISDLASATPLKRLKVAESRKNVSSNRIDDDADDNLLENDGDYSDWIPLKSIDGKIPTKPGIYEVKVWRAKKTAYIGHCESLRQKMTLHKLQQNSGHKHLDKFIDRNMDDIQIRYEVMSSIDNAKSEVKNRVKNFVSQYKTTPAYN